MKMMRKNNGLKTLEAYCNCPCTTCTGCNTGSENTTKYNTTSITKSSTNRNS